jgi:hypothetical protein
MFGKKKEWKVLAPMSGTVKPIEEVDDEAFAEVLKSCQKMGPVTDSEVHKMLSDFKVETTIENQGDEVSDYWYEIVIDDVIRNVDEAVRIRVYKDDKVVTYAKKSAATGQPEKDTVAFVSEELIAREHVTNFKPGDKSKYTIVLWIEGSDLDCTDNILGGEFKVHLDFKSEFIDEKKEG